MDTNEKKEILHHDRIAEAYEGAMGERFMLRMRERVDWICEQAGDGKILDIGCSQGTCPLLLGRNGAEVTGVDIDPEAIRYAVDHLLEEPLEVQSRVRYLCADFMSMELPEAHYDAVLMTEILEHLEEPVRFLDKAVRLLRDGGRMIVTVPFGINAHADHKRTYYLSELFRQLSERLTVVTVEFFNGWIGFLALKNAAGVPSTAADLDLIAREEAAFFKMEQTLRDDLQKAKQKNQSLNEKVGTLSDSLKERTEREQESKTRIDGLEEELRSCQKDLTDKEAAIRTAREELAARDASAKEAEAEWKTAQLDFEERLHAAENTIQDCSSALGETKAELSETLARLQQSENDLKETNEQLRQSEESATKQKEELSKCSGELKQTKHKLALTETDRNELRKKLDDVEREHKALLETSAGHRAYFKLLKTRLRDEYRAAKAEKRAYRGSLLRRIAKKIPFLVRIVKRIRRRHPESEFLFLEASRSDYRKNTAAVRPSAVRAPAASKPAAAHSPELTAAVSETKETSLQKPSAAANASKPEPKPDPRVMTREQENFIDSLRQKIDSLPESNGCRYFEKSRLRIGILCDEFFFDSINAAADFVPMTPADWKELLPTVDVLLVVTLWRGLHDEWRGVANVAHPDLEKINAIFDMIAEAKQLGMPTVFFSKEDPPNYSVFIEFAKRCDYIFTTAEECLPDYVRDTGNPEPRVLRFSVNPLFHNPVGFRKFDKEKTVMFSGSWMEKYPDRCRDMSMLFDGVLSSSYGLHIIDRNYPSNRKYLFPCEYFPCVSPALDHATLQKVHKLFDWAINTNSVQFSRTMFANRAYELQASGVLLLSNYSRGVNLLLPNVFMAFSSEEVRAILETYGPEEIYERQIAGIRSVMRSDTCFDRMDELFQVIGMEKQQKTRRIAVIGDPTDPAVAGSFARQTFPDIALIAPGNAAEDVLKDYDMVAFFGSGMRYGEFYLEDLANAFKYTDCDYITKDAFFEGGQLHEGTEHDYVSVMGSRCRTLFWKDSFNAQTLLEMQDGTELPNGYSIDRFNYDACSATAPAEERSEPYRLSVIVPVCNNGPHLYGKCFSSLRRSSLFRDMEILLVDDGSTDGVTPKYVSYLASRYGNVKTLFNEPEGSGTVFKARYKGAEMATAEYLAFLDPENEASEDGYAKLLDRIGGGESQIALGDNLEADTSIRRVSRYETALSSEGTDCVEAKRLTQSGLLEALAPNLQAMVISAGALQKAGTEELVEAFSRRGNSDGAAFMTDGTVCFVPVSAFVDYRAKDEAAARPDAEKASE